MNAYLFTGWISQFKAYGEADSCRSLIICTDNTDEARARFEASLLSPNQAPEPTPTKVEKIVFAPLLGHLFLGDERREEPQALLGLVQRRLPADRRGHEPSGRQRHEQDDHEEHRERPRSRRNRGKGLARREDDADDPFEQALVPDGGRGFRGSGGRLCGGFSHLRAFGGGQRPVIVLAIGRSRHARPAPANY